MKNLILILTMLLSCTAISQEPVQNVTYKTSVLLTEGKDTTVKSLNNPITVSFHGNIIKTKQGLKRKKYKFHKIVIDYDVNLGEIFFISMERHKKSYILCFRFDYGIVYIKDCQNKKTIWATDPLIINNESYDTFMERNWELKVDYD